MLDLLVKVIPFRERSLHWNHLSSATCPAGLHSVFTTPKEAKAMLKPDLRTALTTSTVVMKWTGKKKKKNELCSRLIDAEVYSRQIDNPARKVGNY